MTRLCAVALLLASATAHAARPPMAVKIRRAAAVAVVGGALLGTAHAAELGATIDQAMRPGALAGLVLPEDLGAPQQAYRTFGPVTTTSLAPQSASPIQLAFATETAVKPSTSVGTLISNVVLGSAHRAVQEWADSTDSTVAKAALYATDPTHFSVSVKLRPVAIKLQYSATFK